MYVLHSGLIGPGQAGSAADVCILSSCSIPGTSSHQGVLPQPPHSSVRSQGRQRRLDATTILKILCQCSLLQPHMYDLLVAK